MDKKHKNITEQVNKVLNQISKAKKELDDLRSKCSHVETEVKNDSNSEVYSVRKVCIICKKAVGYPTEEELKASGYTSETD